MIKKFTNRIYIALIALFLGSCTFFDMELTKDPNALSPDDANIDYVLNAIQINFKEFLNDPNPATWNGVNKFGMEVTRMINVWGNTYESAYIPTNFDATWGEAYEGVLMDAYTYIPEYEQKGWFMHSGIAKTIQAFTLATLVDFWGNIPYSESFNPDNFNPAADNQQVLYDQVFDILDSAIDDFSKESNATPSNDLFYEGDATKWVTLAKTIKLKLLLNLKLVDASRATNGINALIDENDLIDNADEEFMFKYSSIDVNPDSRHPYFIYNYLNGGNDYMANYFMWTLYGEKNVIDPRIRYYFYRQTTTSSEDFQELPCFGTEHPSHYPDWMPYCTLQDGYWGRDHLDGDGIPPDTRSRTLFGIYPGGGKFDADNSTPGNASSGLQGAGAEVIMLSCYVKFMLAEAALTLGTTGDAKTLLLEGVQQSIETVMNFGATDASAPYIPTEANISDYLDEVASLYDNAASDDERMEIIAKEYYIASFGNGIEPYNLIRRTLHPSNLQPALLEAAGEFMRTFIYPAACVNLNSSIPQKTSNAVQVFWDTNPAGAIQ